MYINHVRIPLQKKLGQFFIYKALKTRFGPRMQTWRQIQGNLRFWVTLRAILLALLTELCLHADPTCCLFRVLRYKKRFTKIRIFTGPWEGLKVASMCQNNFETFLAGGSNAPILTQEAPILAQEPSILEPNPLVLFTLKSSTTKKKFTKKRVLRCPWEGLKVAPMGQNNLKNIERWEPMRRSGPSRP